MPQSPQTVDLVHHKRPGSFVFRTRVHRRYDQDLQTHLNSATPLGSDLSLRIQRSGRDFPFPNRISLLPTCHPDFQKWAHRQPSCDLRANVEAHAIEAAFQCRQKKAWHGKVMPPGPDIGPDRAETNRAEQCPQLSGGVLLHVEPCGDLVELPGNIMRAINSIWDDADVSAPR